VYVLRSQQLIIIRFLSSKNNTVIKEEQEKYQKNNNKSGSGKSRVFYVWVVENKANRNKGSRKRGKKTSCAFILACESLIIHEPSSLYFSMFYL
jgi:hypothetical protein